MHKDMHHESINKRSKETVANQRDKEYKKREVKEETQKEYGLIVT